jgi:M6 family metalloprotease-like protein
VEIKLQRFRIENELRQNSVAENGNVVTGDVRIPIILVGFQNKPFTKTVEDFELLFNQPNYTADGLTGSLYDYFYAISHGNLRLTVDIFGPYTLPNEIRLYDDECTTGGVRGNPSLMARQAVDSAAANGCDFSDYDPHNTGFVIPHIIFAGYCQAAGGSRCNSIWSHAWVLNPDTTGTNPNYPNLEVTHNGVQIVRYSCSPELRGSSGSNLTHIGVIAHELGHSLLGLPDFYATNGLQNIVTPRNWCLMDFGCWFDDGRTPTFISAWGRVAAGWVPEIVLESPEFVTMPSPTSSDAIYRINTTTENDYFLLENRQRTGWDVGIHGDGLLIYHVRRTPSDLSVWTNNQVNNIAGNRRYYVKQAGCNTTNGCQNRTTDPWPQSGKIEFSDNSVPNSRSWLGANTEKPITNIVHNTNSRTVLFEFMGGKTDHFVLLSEIGTFVFQARNFGYDDQAGRTVTVKNAGIEESGILNIAISGENASDFTLSATSIPSITTTDGTDNFTIAPKTGLNTGTYTATITATGDNDFLWTFNVSFTVNRAAGAPVEKPTYSTITSTSITLNTINAPENGQTIEYAIAQTAFASVAHLTWQTETTFDGLEEDTTYFAYARTVQNMKYNAGTATVSEAMRTPKKPNSTLNFEEGVMLKVYPNPVINGELKIENGEWKTGDVVEIYNMNGKRVFIERLPDTGYPASVTIDISHLPNGTYIVKIGTASTKIVKQ